MNRRRGLSASDPAARRLGTVLVALQFASLLVLGMLALPAWRAGQVPPAAWLLAIASALLGLWALTCNRPGNFNIRPAPRAGGQLVRGGPYRWIRHPMYTAVMSVGAALAWAAHTPWAAAAFALLVGVLATKAGLEERWMREHHAGYAAYAARTRRFLPWIV